MTEYQDLFLQNSQTIQELLAASGYGQKAIDYFMSKTNMGSLCDAAQVTELTGPCGDTMRIYLKMDDGHIEDAKIEVLGCPALERGEDGKAVIDPNRCTACGLCHHVCPHGAI